MTSAERKRSQCTNDGLDFNPILFWHLRCDAGTQNPQQAAVRASLTAENPDGPALVAFGGDNAYPDGADGMEMQHEWGVFNLY